MIEYLFQNILALYIGGSIRYIYILDLYVVKGIYHITGYCME